MEVEVLGNSGGSCRISGEDRVKQSSLVAQTDLSLRKGVLLCVNAEGLQFGIYNDQIMNDII